MSLGSLLRHIGITLGVLGSFMKHLGHQNRKKDVYDGDIWHMTMILGHSGVISGHSGVALGHFGVTLVSCGGHFGHMEVPLGNLGPLWDYLRLLWVN